MSPALPSLRLGAYPRRDGIVTPETNVVMPSYTSLGFREATCSSGIVLGVTERVSRTRTAATASGVSQ